MSRRYRKQRKRKKWIDGDPANQGWKFIRRTPDSKVYLKAGKLFYVRW